jgi:ABC-2 type transport system permease protein
MTGGHVMASVIVNGVAVVMLLGVAMAIGYRPSAGWAEWGVTLGLLLAALVAFSIMGVGFGLAAKTAEGSTVFSYLLMGLLFVSSGFAPTGAMPAAVRAFADHQPMTSIIDAIRDAQLGQVDPGATVRACAWLAAVIVGFGALTGAMGRRRAALLG